MKKPGVSLRLSGLRCIVRGGWDEEYIMKSTGCSRRTARRFMSGEEKYSRAKLMQKAKQKLENGEQQKA